MTYPSSPSGVSLHDSFDPLCSYRVMDVLRTHPMVIIESVLKENSLYVPPDDFFLRELKVRCSDSAYS